MPSLRFPARSRRLRRLRRVFLLSLSRILKAKQLRQAHVRLQLPLHVIGVPYPTMLGFQFLLTLETEVFTK